MGKQTFIVMRPDGKVDLPGFGSQPCSKVDREELDPETLPPAKKWRKTYAYKDGKKYRDVPSLWYGIGQPIEEVKQLPEG